MTTAAELMTVDIPRGDGHHTVGDMIATLRRHAWEEVGHVYLVDDQAALVGQVPIERLFQAKENTSLAELKGLPPLEVLPGDAAETVALRAVERHDADVAVIDNRRRLLGAIPIGRLLALLHDEHVDNFLRMGGVSRVDLQSSTGQQTLSAVRARMPWLLVGLAGGFLAGGVASAFEVSLKREVALAFFLPLVVYMADAVGTQTETLIVRGLSVGVSMYRVVWRELLTGLLVGGALALLFFPIGLWRWRQADVALTVSLALLFACSTATVVAMALPWVLYRLGRDPAFGSGPLATVIQDLLSIIIYFAIALAVVG